MKHKINNKLWTSYLILLLLLSSTILVLPLQSIPALKKLDKQSQYEFHYILPQLTQEEQTISEEAVFLLYSFQNCQFLSEPGKPKLPFTTSYIHIPTNAKDIQVTILSDNQHEERVVFPIYPAEKQVIRDDSNLGISYAYTEFCYDEEFYAYSENFYPANQVEIAEIGKMRDYRYLAVNIYPLQYQASENILRFSEEMTIQVTWINDDNIVSENTTKPSQHTIKGLQMLNDDDVEEITSFIKNAQVIYPTDLSDPTNQATYLIITAEQFYTSPSLENIAHHRAVFSGMNVAVVQTSDIYAAIGDTIPIDPTLNDTEGDIDLRIKTFIKYVYDFWDDGAHSLQYVLLVGDPYPDTASFFLPFHPSLYRIEGTQIVTDYWYSCINDDNGDGYVNDSDTVADVFIGRFSVQTEEELAVVVEKTIQYELYPPSYPEEDWGGKTLLTHAKGSPPLPNPMEQIRDIYLLPYHREVSEVYADKYSNYLNAKEAMKSKIDEGHALFAHVSHGGATLWHIGSSISFTTSDVDSLSNADRLPVVFSMSCWTGMFDYSGRQGLAEVFVNSLGKGSVAFLGSSRPSYEDENKKFLTNIMDAIIVEDNLVLGSCIVEAKLGPRVIGFNRLLYNLLGDPALNMSQTVTVSEKPELSCSLHNYVLVAENVAFNISISNLGLSDATNVLVELFNRNPFDEGVLIQDATHYRDVPAETTMSYTLTIPLQQEWGGNFYTELFLIIDREGEIDELYENNNLSQSLFFVVNETYYFSAIGMGSTPAIYENKIVWQDERNGEYMLLFYDLGQDGRYGTEDDSGEIRLTTSSYWILNPAIFGNKIVWEDFRNSGNKSDIFMYDLDLGAEFCITNAYSNQKYPDIYDTKIVWEDRRNGASNIYFYDLGSDGLYGTDDDSGEIRMTYNNYQDNPDIDGNKIVWTSIGYTMGVFLYDLGPDGIYGTDDDSETVQITTSESVPCDATINGTKIVWTDYRDGQWDIYLYELGSDGVYGTDDDSGEVQITTAPSSDETPSISGNKIIWKGDRNENPTIYINDLFFYDLGLDGIYGTDDDSGEIQLTKNEYLIKGQGIYGNKIVHGGAVFVDDEFQYTTYLISIDKAHSSKSSLTSGCDTPRGLFTCPAGDGSLYPINITLIDSFGYPIEGIPASDFTFMVLNIPDDTSWFGYPFHDPYLTTTKFTVNPEESETDERGMIQFMIQANTSIVGNISITANVRDVTLSESLTLWCNSADINTNGRIDLTDITLFSQIYFSLYDFHGDFFWDESINLADITYLTTHIGHHHPSV
ncbi:MAG: C25 family cysteine peptidase [Methanobacteriota archaeon]